LTPSFFKPNFRDNGNSTSISMQAEPNDRFSLKLPFRWELPLFILFFGLAIFLRTYHLTADFPEGISFSQELGTDPPQYTIFARNAALTGDWNPYHDHRYITYEYSLVSAAARVVFGVFGTGMLQTNLAAAILSLLSILLLYLVLRKALGNGVALTALLFLTANYISIFYGRYPFLENGMNLLFLIGLFCLVYFEKRVWGHVLFGAFTAAAIVFGKIIGLSFLGVVAAYYAFRAIYLRDKKTLYDTGAMSAGFLAVSAIWYFLIFLPHASTVIGYVSEQAFGLYGTPQGLTSFKFFVWKFLGFGISPAFFSRMSGLSVATLFMIGLLASILVANSRQTHAERFSKTIIVVIAAWLISAYLAQMPWNYRPLRYQTTMIFPIAALAAVLVAYLIKLPKKINILNRSIVFNLIFFVLLLLFLYHLAAAICIPMAWSFSFRGEFLYVLLSTLLIYFVYVGMIWGKRTWQISLPRFVPWGITFLLIVTTGVSDGRRYLNWSQVLRFTNRQSSRDLGMILSPQAVISGPYAPALALENKFGCIVNIFGVTCPDTLLFKKFPITHLVLEESNEEKVREFYPEIMEKAERLCSYNVNGRRLSVFRIAYATGNQEAAGYSMSDFERSVNFYRTGDSDSGDFYLKRFVSLNPENFSGNVGLGTNAMKSGYLDSAVVYFQRAAEFSPTDFHVHYWLSQAYIGLADNMKSDSLRALGKKEERLAVQYNLASYPDAENEKEGIK